MQHDGWINSHGRLGPWGTAEVLTNKEWRILFGFSIKLLIQTPNHSLTSLSSVICRIYPFIKL